MKIALVNLTGGGLSGGYTKYLKALLPLLERDPRVSALTIFVPPGSDLPLAVSSPVRTWPSNDGARGYRDLRAQLAGLAPDVVFFPTARLIRAAAVPTVVMVRNMEPLTVPFGGNSLREGLKNLARARAARLACRRASRVIAVSEHVRRFVTGRWSIPNDRVGVVYHGIEAPSAGGAPTPPAMLHGRSGFLFTAGSIRPARGIEDLIRAMPAVLQATPAQTLVIAGGVDASGEPYARRMRALARTLGVEQAIIWTGHLTPAEMAWSYRACAAFVVTSRAEACPNVALEAMSHGARIVSTTQDPMPEFFGDVAAYYSPEDSRELARQINQTLLERAGDGSRARAAVSRAERYTWERTADQTIRELQRAIDPSLSASSTAG